MKVYVHVVQSVIEACINNMHAATDLTNKKAMASYLYNNAI